MTDSPSDAEIAPPTDPARPTEPAPPTEPASPTETAPTATPTATPAPPASPLYKGEPLDADRGPGLGCFWTQVVVLVAVLLLIPFGVDAHWPIWATGLLLALSMVLILFVSLTVIFLLRLVSADRRARRRPLRSGARPTVGQLEDREEGMRQ
ncbi:MAG TPA: hypothetical protein VMH24_05315 [Candidatus Sulfotelmatobacter sp.]|nr:hypothetical protein [Candidatus Sulfotelmatobacter sp.]